MLLRTRMGVYQIRATITINVLTALYVLTYAKHEDYKGWKFYYINATTIEQVRDLNSIRSNMNLDFLSPAHVKREAVVLVRPEHKEDLIKKLNQFGIKYNSDVDDIKSVLDTEDEINELWTKSIGRSRSDIISFNSYQRLDEINAYMEHIAQKYERLTTLVTAAKSFEGRPIKYMRISSSKFQKKIKPVIFIEGGMHAREWISPPTVTWAIRKLTEDLTELDLLRHFDWILMPVANPDGYEYSFRAKRMWRKNRSRNHPNDHFCPGVDGNRNFDIAWNTFHTDSDPCSNLFPGNSAFSEIETRVIRDILQKHQPHIVLFLSMHSYGNFILYPWGHNLTRSYNYDALNSVALAMADAFLDHGSPDFLPPTVGSIAGALYKCSGTAASYAHHIGVPLAFIYELPGFKPTRDAGFHLNPMYIEDVCRAAWAGITVGARKARSLL